jgi:hypothetical protein
LLIKQAHFWVRRLFGANMPRNLIKELNNATPGTFHAKLGSLLEGFILTFNAVLAAKATKFSLGSPAAAVADALIKAATGAELPNADTITYTTADDNTTPLDGSIAAPANVLMSDGVAHLVWALDVPRNIASTTTHASAVVAMTILVTGFDQYKQPLSELLTVTAGTTSKAVAGKKAFKYIESIAIASAGNATTNTLNAGFGDVLGLPYQLIEKSDLLSTWFNQVEEATLPTVVVADTNTETTTTGDKRGTIDLNSALDGSTVRVWMNAGADYVAAHSVTPLSER